MCTYSSRVALAFLLAALSTAAYGVDGVVLIDQNRALAGNVTPGDAPGFPVSITQPGSYKLSGILTVPDTNTDGIVISADHVTIDLNGFAILGSAVCSSAGCSPTSGQGDGIETSGPTYDNITVRNGTIQGMGGSGLNLFGSSLLVEYLHVRSNSARGMQIFSGSEGTPSVVRHNIVEQNGGVGIILSAGLVSDNIVNANNQTGIFVGKAIVVGNFFSRNHGFGLIGDTKMVYYRNLFSDNMLGSASSGRSLGGNVCDGALNCP
jgi:parallel beta helix pectate lyase-like protein